MRIALAVLFVVGLLAPSAAHGSSGLPLGPPALPETRDTELLAPGVTYTKIVRGELAERDGWTVDVAIVADRAQAADLLAALRAAGFDADVSVLERPPDDREHGPLGYRVRSGFFATRAESDAHAAAIVAAGIAVRGSVFTAEDGERTSGPWIVHVLSVSPRASGGSRPC